jgi:hypothetical protein
MEDWFSLVNRAHDFLSSAMPDKTYHSDRTADSFALQTLRDMALQDDEAKKNKILNNLQVAAMHLAYIKAGKLDLVDDDVLEKISSVAPGLHTLSLRRLRLPLVMAAFVSPLCLLMPKKLYTMEVSKETILDVWQSLGNRRPDSIKRVEDILWSLLNDLSSSNHIEVEVFSTINVLLKEMDNMDDSLHFWFKSDNTLMENWHFGEACIQEEETEGGEGRKDEDRGSDKNTNEEDVSMQVDEGDGEDGTKRGGEDGGEANESMDDAPGSPDVSTGEGGSGGDVGFSGDGMNGVQRGEEDKEMDDGQLGEEDKQMDGGQLGEEDEQTDGGKLGEESESSGDEDEDKEDKFPSKTRRALVSVSRRNPKRRFSGSAPAEPRSQKRPFRKEVHKPPTSVQQVIDLTQAWTAPPPLSVHRDSYPMPALASSAYRIYSHRRDIYVDYSAHVPHDSDRAFFEEVAKSVKPVHLDSPGDSAFYVVGHDQFESMSAKDVQRIFQKQNIVVTDVPLGHVLQFDRKGLETLCPWKKPKMMQDFSIAIEGSNYAERQVWGTLQLLHQHAQMQDGRVLNALDFPLASGPSPSLYIASDLRAWDSTMDSPLATRSIEYPINHMRWGLAATKGAQHTWHIDSMGVGTCIQVKTGAKWWVVGRPKDGREDIINIDDESVDVEISASNDNIWNVEGMLLKPGMTFFMRPNTPHAVFTLDHSITHGSHFIATSTLRQTCYGIVHSFLLSSAITNTDNGVVWVILQRLMCYYHQAFTSGDWKEPEFDPSHIPDIVTSSGVVDLYTFMVLLELANALHVNTYSRKGLEQMERHRIIEARRLARELRKWVAANFVVEMTERPEEDLFVWMLASMSVRLVSYLKEARKYDIKATSSRCSVKRMSAEIYDVISGEREVLSLISTQREALKGSSIAWTAPVSVTPRSEPCEFDVSRGFTTTGYTPGDFSFFASGKPPSMKVDLAQLFFGLSK